MFDRSFLLSAFIVFVIFVSTLNAIKCHNFQYQTFDKRRESFASSKSEKECVGCTGYMCKNNDGKIIFGSTCTEDLKEICQNNWGDAAIQEMAKQGDGGFLAQHNKYFVYSCQKDYCNTVHWFDKNIVKHIELVADTFGLFQNNLKDISQKEFIDFLGRSHKKLSIREKRVPHILTAKCYINGEEVPCKCVEKDNKGKHYKIEGCSGSNKNGYGISLVVASFLVYLFH
uniref:Uncharacterized protein n=1 Tax=Panagrolaimus davidi TaxID=227884 RepID=A0A914PXX4_9BILA